MRVLHVYDLRCFVFFFPINNYS